MVEVRQCPECSAELPGDAPEGLCPKCLLEQGLCKADEAEPQALGTSPFHGPFVAPAPSQLAPHFPQLEILELLGQGGMGAVYKARQPKLDRLIALKILPPEWGRDPAFAERFTREARALARLNHPNIVAVHDFGEADGLFFFIMEYVDGVNLRQLIQAGGVQPKEALKIVPQICEALQYAHDEQIVHRDIKPENILLDKRGRVKIADFGLAKLMSPTPAVFRLTGTRQVMGTPQYMAPEQMEKPHLVDHRADIYSLGVVFYEMLTNELPLGRFAPPSHKVPVDVRLDDVVLRTLAKEPEKRYQHASEVKVDVDSIVNGTLRAAQPVVPATPQVLDRETALDLVRAPATGLWATGLLTCLFYAVLVIIGAILLDHPRDWGAGLALVITGAIGIEFSALVWFGAARMRQLQAYEFAVTATILGILPLSPLFIVSLVFGIWGFLILRRPEVRAAFHGSRPAPARVQVKPASPPQKQRGPILRKVVSLVQGARSLFLNSRVTADYVPPSQATMLRPEAEVPAALPADGAAGPAPAAAAPLPQLAMAAQHAWPLDVADAHRRMRWPALWVTLVGVLACVFWIIVILVQVFDAFGGHFNDEEIALLVFEILALAIGGLVILGAGQMRSLEMYGLAIAAAVLAMLPWSGPVFLLGFPVGIWALLRLTSPEVRAAFQRPRLEAQDPLDARPWRYVRFGAFLVLILAAVGVGIGLFVTSLVTYRRSMSESAYAWAQARRGPYEEKPGGLEITPEYASRLRLLHYQIDEANQILREIHQEYLALEPKYTKRSFDKQFGELRVTIDPFPDEILALERRFHAQLDKVLEPQQRGLARTFLRLQGPPFDFGYSPFEIEIRRDSYGFTWRARYFQGGYQTEERNTGPRLPPQYERFWKPTKPEDTPDSKKGSSTRPTSPPDN